ncbi:MAG: hypothetical protein MPK62_02150 [Alphaproteobacteria bacterium]|nr:hypothetical protein [Alphaproteobacteria bacterium]
MDWRDSIDREAMTRSISDMIGARVPFRCPACGAEYMARTSSIKFGRTACKRCDRDVRTG